MIFWSLFFMDLALKNNKQTQYEKKPYYNQVNVGPGNGSWECQLISLHQFGSLGGISKFLAPASTKSNLHFFYQNG